METEMLSGVPLGVYQYNVSSNAMMELMTSMMETQPNDSQTSYPDSDEIKVSSSSSYDGAMAKMMLSIVKSFMDGVTKKLRAGTLRKRLSNTDSLGKNI